MKLEESIVIDGYVFRFDGKTLIIEAEEELYGSCPYINVTREDVERLADFFDDIAAGMAPRE